MRRTLVQRRLRRGARARRRALVEQRRETFFEIGRRQIPQRTERGVPDAALLRRREWIRDGAHVLRERAERRGVAKRTERARRREPHGGPLLVVVEALERDVRVRSSPSRPEGAERGSLDDP